MKSEVKRFQLIYFLYYVVFAIFYGFLIPYLSSLGISNTRIGLWMSVMTCFGVVGQFLTGYICDLKKTIKKIFILGMSSLSIGVLLFFRLNQPLAQIICLSIVGFFLFSLTALMDSWSLENSENTKMNFGPIRAFGSLGWAIAAVVVGKLIDQYGFQIIPTTFIIFMVALLILLLRTEDVKKETCNKMTIKSIKALLTNKRYINLLMIYLLLYMVFQSINMFSPILIDQFGGTKADVGRFLFISAISEIPMFFLANRCMKRFKPSFLLIIAASIFAIRMMIMGVCGSVIQIVLLGLFQMFSYSIIMFTSKYLIDEITPSDMKTTSQMVALAVFMGGGGMLSLNISGILSDFIGIQNTLFFQGGLGFIALLLSVKYHYDYYVVKSVRGCRDH